MTAPAKRRRARKETRGQRVIRFIETYLVVPDGNLIGKPFRLLNFQKKFILEVYDNPAGTRHAILSIGRKNGKTALMACLVLAHLVGPEAVENSQIESGARSRDQAAKLWKYARDIARMSPKIGVGKNCRVRQIESRKVLIGVGKSVTYTALAAEASSAHGGSPILALRDEVGQVKGPTDDFFTAMETSQGAHDSPLLIDISTQAPTDADLLSITIDDAQTGADPSIVCHLYAADDDCGLLDRKQWLKANPAMAEFRSVEDLAKFAGQADRSPTKENDFRNLYLNQRVSVFSPFVGPKVWKANAGAVDRELFYRTKVYGGLDLSQTTDLTAFVLIAQDDDGSWHVLCFFWMAQDLLEDRAKDDRKPYDLWAKQGLIRATPGKSIDFADVARDMLSITEGMDLQEIAFDPHLIDTLKRHLQIEGGRELPLVPCSQRYGHVSPGIQSLEIELLHERCRHGGNPVLQMCARNAAIQKDDVGNRRFTKKKSRGRIDGMVALGMAMGRACGLAEAVPEIGIIRL